MVEMAKTLAAFCGYWRSFGKFDGVAFGGLACLLAYRWF